MTWKPTSRDWVCPHCGELWAWRTIRFGPLQEMIALIPGNPRAGGLWVLLLSGNEPDRCPACFPWVWIDVPKVCDEESNGDATR